MPIQSGKRYYGMVPITKLGITRTEQLKKVLSRDNKVIGHRKLCTYLIITIFYSYLSIEFIER